MRLETPSLVDRILIAMDVSGLTQPEITRQLRAIGVPVGAKYIYRMLNGEVVNTSVRKLAGLAYVFGTDVRWFCETDDDGALYAALEAYWSLKHSSTAQPEHTE